ncbi:protein male abnormal 21-like [Actinia tenebrosa]|uniref:Protein male abnormal 21-like n=1 Tax=Actinia tenebrosa TaxID=6105 RepID=A0A6P8HVD3_ACTTE|nr:protein male abnormal 21-like [Actinia tenebrosa]
MDFTSSLHWSELNCIIMDNFKDRVPKSEAEDGATFVFPFFQLATNVMSGNRFLWSGSVAENSFVNPTLRKAGWEADVMLMSADFVISRDMQLHLFQDIPDEPGYVKVEATENIENDEVLVFKEITHSDGHSHLYIVPDLQRFSPYDTDSLLKTSRKNILVQSIFDTFELDNLSCELQPHGPAFAHSMNGFSSVFELVARPKRTVSKFLGHLGTRVLEHFDAKPHVEKEVHQESSIKKGGQMFDYMKPQTDAVIPDIGLMMDICPAIKCEGWPHKALRFFHRTRVWPDHTILNKLLQSSFHFHLVYKPLNPLSQDSVEWRISFSQAEISLFQSMDAFRIYCYRIFKAIYYSELTLPKVLSSYHMKTIFLWACERIPSEMWVESNLAQIIMGLLDDLLHCLVTKNCPHYFIPENNLFAHVHQDFLDHLAKVVAKIRRNPERYPLVKTCSVDQSAAQSASGDQDKPQNESLDDGIELD